MAIDDKPTIKFINGPPPLNWDDVTPMTGSHIPGVDTGAQNGMTTFMGSGGQMGTISSGMGSFGMGSGLHSGSASFAGNDSAASGLRQGNGSGPVTDATLQATVGQMQSNFSAELDAGIEAQTGQMAMANVNAQGQALINQEYADATQRLGYPGSVGEFTRGVQYDRNGFAIQPGNGNMGEATANSEVTPPSLGGSFQTPFDQEIKTDTAWYDYANQWLNYAQQVPSAASSLDTASIDAAREAFKAATDAWGTSAFANKLQTATAAINTMITANGWSYGPPTNTSGQTGPVTLPAITVTPSPGEVVGAPSAPVGQDQAPAGGWFDGLRQIGNAVSSDLAKADQGIAKFNGIVSDELVDEGAQDLRDGNKAGFYWNAIKYSIYNTFMPNSVEGAAASVAGGAVAGKVLGVVAKGATKLFPVLGKEVSKIGGEATSDLLGGSEKLADKNVERLEGVAESGAVEGNKFPPNNGFLGKTVKLTLESGQKIDRYGGSSYSKFFSPPGTPIGARSLPLGVSEQPLRTFVVLRPFEVDAGTVAPWYNQSGLGKQYRSPMPLRQLLEERYVKEVTHE